MQKTRSEQLRAEAKTLKKTVMERGNVANNPMMISDQHAKILDLIDVVSKVRQLCPWDQNQDQITFLRHTRTEVIELTEAVYETQQEDTPKYRREMGLLDELGDVLLCILMHARIAEDDGRFNIYDIAENAAKKVIRRHPHVFGDEIAETEEEARRIYLRVKGEENA